MSFDNQCGFPLTLRRILWDMVEVYDPGKFDNYPDALSRRSEAHDTVLLTLALIREKIWECIAEFINLDTDRNRSQQRVLSAW